MFTDLLDKIGVLLKGGDPAVTLAPQDLLIPASLKRF